MKKVSYYLAKVSCAVCSLILIAAISGCSGKKSGKATMRRQYREMARELDYISDPMKRSGHSDKMQSLNQQIGDLEIYMLQKYGKPF